jgi:hypothetical protein
MAAKMTTTALMTESEQLPEIRDKDGTFLPGKSGNPSGRPKGRKNQLTVLKQDLEIAIRENASPADVAAVVSKMIQMALEGNVGAGKVILDKFVSNAKEGEDERESGGQLKIIIENAQLDVNPQTNVIEMTAEEVTNE